MTEPSVRQNRMAPFITALLAGYAMGAPFKLAVYFYPKPQTELLINGLFFAAPLVIFLYLFRSTNLNARLRFWSAIFLSTLVLGRFWTEFTLFSKTFNSHFVSYFLTVLCALALAMNVNKKVYAVKELALLIVTFAMGFVLFWQADGILINLILISLIAWMNLASLPGISSVFVLRAVILVALFVWGIMAEKWQQVTFFESQAKHSDKVVFSQATRFQRVDVTEWKGHYWYYQNEMNQFSSIDAWLYFEPMTHPVMALAEGDGPVLVIGGENGMLVRELLKYPNLKIDVLPVDKEMLRMASEESLFVTTNEGSLSNSSVRIQSGEIFPFLSSAKGKYKAIFVDVPDPIDIELNQYFTREFYNYCHSALGEEGVLVTQAGSPYFATKAFQSVKKTLESANFGAIAFHNQVLTLGEWGWVIGSKTQTAPELKEKLGSQEFSTVNTQWLDQEAMQMMLSFGKPYVLTDSILVNTIERPVIHQYYNRGNYQLQ